MKITDDKLRELGLAYSDGKPFTFIYCGYGNIFYYPDKEKKEPLYALYYGGTNDLKILKRYNNEWSKINFEDVGISNLYGLMWQLGAEIIHMRYKIQNG